METITKEAFAANVDKNVKAATFSFAAALSSPIFKLSREKVAAAVERYKKVASVCNERRASIRDMILDGVNASKAQA